MSKGLIKLSQTGVDLLVLLASLTLAFLIRFDGAPPPLMVERLLLTAPYVVGLEYGTLVLLGVHRFSWRFIGVREVSRILLTIGSATLVLVLTRLVAGQLQYSVPYLRHGVIPFGVVAINFVLTLLGVCGVRIVRRIWGERVERRRRVAGVKPVRTLLIGAGQAGVLVARELQSRPDLALRPVGFVDDDSRKVGSVIHGLSVLGTTEQIPALCARLNAKQCLITMANVPGSAIRRIRRLCEDAGIAVKIIPGVYEIVGGQVNLSRIRDVAIEDLLRREPVELELDSIRGFIRGRTVLATGAGGSIGSELCRQICSFGPERLLLVERSENALFNIHRELVQRHPDVEIVPCVADITDRPRMVQLMRDFKPQLLLHAAAHKHVPIMEWNPVEGVKNNVFGTKTVADLAVEHGVEAFVMISTDKAVNPTSVMGATKRAAELYVQALAALHRTRFVTVRFGNVLGSAGSVVPIFKEQIAAGGPITITHPDMRRYFMTIPEACQLVLQAGTMGQGGEIFVLDMGQPVKIVDLARDLIALSGLRPEEDIEIKFSGVRPGEKLFEELSTDAEHADKTKHPKIFIGRTREAPSATVKASVEQLQAAVGTGDEAGVIASLRRMVPEFSPEASASINPPPSEQATPPREADSLDVGVKVLADSVAS